MARSTQPADLKVALPPPDTTPYLRLALALSLGAAVSLGITRFAYGLLLPPMRTDLGWSYTLAGSMNTANAAGYLLGALAMSWLLQRMAPTRLFLTGAVLATVFMAASGFFTDARALMLQRLLAGLASGLVAFGVVYMGGDLLRRALASADLGLGAATGSATTDMASLWLSTGLGGGLGWLGAWLSVSEHLRRMNPRL